MIRSQVKSESLFVTRYIVWEKDWGGGITHVNRPREDRYQKNRFADGKHAYCILTYFRLSKGKLYSSGWEFSFGFLRDGSVTDSVMTEKHPSALLL